MTLFPVEESPAPVKLSADARRTLRNRQLIERGIHPVTRLRLLQPPGIHTCGSCAHHFAHAHNRVWHKCDLNFTFGAATDVRLSWPACEKWQSETER